MQDRIERIKSFLKETPDDCFLNHALALEYIKQGNDSDARILFDKNLNHDPGYIATYYHLGKLLERNGLQQEAIDMYQRGMNACKEVNEMHTYSELQSAYEDLAY